MQQTPSTLRMGVGTIVLVLGIKGFLIACAADTQSNAQPDAQTISQSSTLMHDELFSRGERLFNLHCMACHSVEAHGRTAAGPQLAEIFDRQIATDPDWAYPSHVAKLDFEWSESRMREWLERPQEMVPNMCLPFRGLRREADIDALMHYLLSTT